MTTQRGKWMTALATLAVLAVPGSSQAQELRRDSKSNGVWIGAGAGAAAGTVIGLATEEICSPGACAYLGAVAGGVIGLLIDRKMGAPRPVSPGSMIDDGLGNGALIGAASGAGIALLEVSRRCRPGKWPPCTRNGILLDVYVTARWMALVGLLIDAAVPSRLQGPPGVVPERSQPRLGVAFDVRF